MTTPAGRTCSAPIANIATPEPQTVPASSPRRQLFPVARSRGIPTVLPPLYSAPLLRSWRLARAFLFRNLSALRVSAHVGPADIYPDPERTPGAANPDISQDNIRQTICNPRWSTKSVRPEVSYTNHLKVEQIREYAYPDSSVKDYEEDHFIPLELGGSPTDPKNLWPEPYEASIPDGGAHAKDKVENYLRAEVCSGSLTLDQAQQEITEDWYRVYTTSVPH